MKKESAKLYLQMTANKLDNCMVTYELLKTHYDNAKRVCREVGVPLPTDAQHAENRSTTSSRPATIVIPAGAFGKSFSLADGHHALIS